MNNDIIIRFAEYNDLQTIVDIYNQAVAVGKTTADTIKVEVSDKITWFNDHKSNEYPLYVAIQDNKVVGWCSISPYRPGRGALKQTAEISYYLDYNFHGKGIGKKLIQHALDDCDRIGIKNLFALILECNEKSSQILEKFGFVKWGYMPQVANFDGILIGHIIYGLNITNSK